VYRVINKRDNLEFTFPLYIRWSTRETI
jgi:hypothetical protein